MRLILLSLFLFIATFSGLAFHTIFAPSLVIAQEDIELPIGQVAKDKEVTGTTNYDPEDANAGFGALIEQILTIVVAIAAIILLLMLLWGALEWLTSGGDKGKVEKARNRITQAIMGMIVLAATIALFVFLQDALNFEIFNVTSAPPLPSGSPTSPPLPPCGPGVPPPCMPVPT